MNLEKKWLPDAVPKVANKNTSKQDRRFLETAPEISVFMVLFAMRNSLLDLDRARATESITAAQFSDQCRDILAQFNETAEATYRFDILAPVEDVGQYSPFFWRWFHWWDDYLKGLTPEALKHAMDLAVDRRPGLELYRPEGSWLDCEKNKPSFSVITS